MKPDELLKAGADERRRPRPSRQRRTVSAARGKYGARERPRRAKDIVTALTP
jgi:hypothetical protein